MAECKDFAEMIAKSEKLCKEQVENLFADLMNSPMHDLIQVFCRLKSIDTNRPSCVTVQSEKTLQVNPPGLKESQRNVVEYSFNKVYTASSTQQAVYTGLSFPLIEDLVDGFNSVLFVYGLEGSGKTHTMIGTQTDPGVLPRCLDTLFNTIADYKARKSYFTPNKANGFKVSGREDRETHEVVDKAKRVKLPDRMKKKEKKDRNKEKKVFLNVGMVIDGVNEMNIFAVFISYVHIYKNNYYDLLDEKCCGVPEAKTTKRDPFDCIYVDNITEIEVRSTSEVLGLYNSARTRMTTYQVSPGQNFNKGHSIFNIRLVHAMRSLKTDEKPKTNQLTVVDLYPWEKNCPEQHRKDTQEELENLQKCMHALNGNREQLTPTPSNKYKLTFLFKHCFKGFTHMNMILCINPEENNYEEIHHALIFASSQRTLANASKPSQRNPVKSREKREPLVKLNFCNVVASTSFARRMVSALEEMKPPKGPYDAEYAFLKRRLKERMIDIRYENIRKLHGKKETRLLGKAQSVFELDKLAESLDEKCCCAPGEDTEKTACINKNMMNRQREFLNQQIDYNVRRQMDKINVVKRMRDREMEDLARCICHEDLATVQKKMQEALDNLNSNQDG